MAGPSGYSVSQLVEASISPLLKQHCQTSPMNLISVSLKVSQFIKGVRLVCFGSKIV